MADSKPLARASEAEEAHDQRLLTLVGCIHGLVLELDGDARYLNVWADDPALLAGPREDVVGRTVDEVLGMQVGPPLTALVQRVFASGTTEHLEYPLVVSGRTRWFFADIKRVCAGATWTVVVFARDISERKEGEEALRQSEERYRLAALATNDVLYDWHIPSAHITWGAAVSAVFLETEAAPSPAWWQERIHPDDAARVKESLERAMNGGDASWSSRYRMRRADGSFAELLDRGFIVRDGARPIRMVGSMADVTQLNRLQAQLIQADRLAAIGLLAAGVGHEINNPLSYVLGNIEYALDGGPFAESARGREREEDARVALLEAHQGANRIAEIVRSLRLFGQNGPVEVSEVRIEDVIERSIKMADNQIRHRARLVRDFQPVPPVTVNESHLGQVCLNLLINAAQAISDGNKDANEIRVTTRLDASGRVILAVSDTGPGIKAEHVDRVFDPFFTTKEAGVGMGIGLSVCRSIVQSMGGDLTVHSVIGERTTFTVTLPRADAFEDPAAPGSAAAAPAAPRRPRLLVIDDDIGVGRYIARVLKSDCDVTTVTSSSSALVKLDGGESFDVVLCDMMMPEMNGAELYAVLRQRHPVLLPHVFFMTGGAFTPEAASFLESLPHAPLEKPIDRERLRLLVLAT